MADYAAYTRGAGQAFYSQHTQNPLHSRNLQNRTRSPTGSRIPFNNQDTPSPSRSQGAQSPQQFSMFNQNQGHGHGNQGHNVMMNTGNNHQRYNMQMTSLSKPFQHNPAHQHHGHAQQHHQDHSAASHGAPFNHQHNVSSGGIASVQPHFGNNHLQNGTPGSVHSGLNKPVSEHWAEQLKAAQTAREMTQSHSHARNHPSVNKSVVAGTGNGNQKETDKEERNRPALQGIKEDHVWTILDFGGQNLKTITSTLFQYTFLTRLYINCNKLTMLPPGIGQLRSLTHLDASLNDLRTLPPEIGMLVNLRQLLLFDNNINYLPPEIGSLFQLEMLGIEGNPIPSEQKEMIMEHGTSELIKHFLETAPGPDPPPDRDWIELEDVSGTNQETVTALTYNILCDKYCTQSMYGYTPSGALQWERRSETILGEIRERDADILCLQEIDQGAFNDFFRPALAHNDYKGMFWTKSRARTMGEKEAKQVDGCAIFYKHSKYVLLDKQLVDFANIAINRPDMKGEHDIFNRVMPRDDIAVIAFLENRVTGSRMIVGNVHVFWNPAFTDVKLVQVAILMESITKFANKWAKHPPCTDKVLYRFANGDDEDGNPVPDTSQAPGPSMEYTDGAQIPLLLCGDFNSTPDSGLYNLIVKGSMSNQHADLGGRKYGNFTRDGISHPFSLKSSYSAVGELNFTNYVPAFCGVLDYIWYSTNTLQVVGLLGDIDKDYLKRVPGFPNYHFPSDHIALFAQYVVKGRKEKKAVVEPDFGQGRDRDRDRRS